MPMSITQFLYHPFGKHSHLELKALRDLEAEKAFKAHTLKDLDKEMHHLSRYSEMSEFITLREELRLT